MKIADTSAQDEVVNAASSHKPWLTITLALAALLGLAVWLAPAAQRWSESELSMPRERVRIDTVAVKDFTRDIAAQGQVVAAVSPKMYAPADGTVSLLLDAGTQVSVGQVLAIIDSPELTNKLQQEQATLFSLQTSYDRQKILSRKQQVTDQKAIDIAQVALTTADREQRRAKQAYKVQAISQLDFEKANDDLDTAKVQHRHALDDATLNKENLEFEVQALAQALERQRLLVADFQRQVDSLTMRSPVNGLLGNLAVENKSYAAKNTLILSVVDLSHFEVEVAVPESYANDLSIGLPVEISVDSQHYAGKLVTISPEVFENQVKGRVRFSAEQPASLRQNQRLSTRILLEQRQQVLQVPRGQFLDASNGRYAYVVRDNMAIKTPISTGARSINAVEVLQGLKAGDQIITSGTDIFQDATRVQLN